MKARWLSLALAAGLLAAYLGHESGSVASPSTPASPIPAPTSTTPPEPASVTAGPLRDPFRYDDAARASEPRPASPIASVHSEAPPERAIAQPHLVGFVRRAGRLLAALSIRGEVVLLGEGEEAEGHLVLSLDEDQGVRVRGPGGEEIVLEPSP